MGIMFGMIWFAFWVFSTCKCEAAIFPLFRSVCMHARPLDDLDAVVLHRAHAPCMHMDVAYAQHDVTRVVYHVIHAIMMSSAFVFHYRNEVA